MVATKPTSIEAFETLPLDGRRGCGLNDRQR